MIRPEEGGWEGVSRALTIRGAQRAEAILLGHTDVLVYATALPRGWYALHVCAAHSPLEASLCTVLSAAGATLKAEEALMHSAIIYL